MQSLQFSRKLLLKNWRSLALQGGMRCTGLGMHLGEEPGVLVGTSRDTAENLFQKIRRPSWRNLVKCILMVMMCAGNAVKGLAEL